MAKAKAPAKKANGTGNITYEADRAKYRARIPDPSGKRISARFSTLREAQEWLTITQASFYQKTYIPKTIYSVGELVCDYINLYCKPNVRPNTMRRYVQTAKHIEAIAGIPIQELTPNTVQAFYNNLPPMSDSSKNKIHKLLKAAYTKAYVSGQISKNIMDAVKAPRITPKEIQIYTEEELQAIANAFKVSQYYSRYYPIFLLAISTGMRRGEILGLKRDCLHRDFIMVKNSLQDQNGKLVDMPPKTAAGVRKIPISQSLYQTLRSLTAQDKIASLDGYVFHTRNGTPIAPRNIERMWNGILDEAGLTEHKVFHALRHTHATQLLANGIPLLEVAHRLGHSKASHTLDLYGHAIPGYDKTIPEKIAKIFYYI